MHREMLNHDQSMTRGRKYLSEKQSIRRACVYFIESMNQDVVPGCSPLPKEVTSTTLAHPGREAGPTSGNQQAPAKSVDILTPESRSRIVKVTSDPYLGKLAMMRILQGRMEGSSTFVCGDDKKTHKAGHVLKIQGKDRPEIESVAYAGDIVALAKVEDIHMDQLLRAPGTPNEFEAAPPRYPTPMYSLAIVPQNRADEVKLSAALANSLRRDPRSRRSTIRRRTSWSFAMGELICALRSRSRNRFRSPSPPSRRGRLSRRSAADGTTVTEADGGAGSLARCIWHRALPRGAGFEFVDEITADPEQLHPVGGKGRDRRAPGRPTGLPHDVRRWYDGTHPADRRRRVPYRRQYAVRRRHQGEPIASR
jgi:elongation factor G